MFTQHRAPATSCFRYPIHLVANCSGEAVCHIVSISLKQYIFLRTQDTLTWFHASSGVKIFMWFGISESFWYMHSYSQDGTSFLSQWETYQRIYIQAPYSST